MRGLLTREERTAIRRTLALLRIDRLQFAWSVCAGVLTIICTVGLSAVSAWLIARASQLPLVSVLGLAATIVRGFGASKPVLRYFRQIAGHRVALDGMATLRSTVYERFADSRIDTVTQIRRGDLLARTGRDVTSVGDLVVRALMPMWVAAVGCLATVGVVAYFSPTIALVVAAAYLVSGLIGPAIAMIGARRSELDQINDRAELAALALTMLESAEELRVSGRLADMERAAKASEHKIFRNRDRAARPTAICTALETIAMLIAVIGAIIIGSAELSAGTLAPVELAIVVLAPLAGFEATTPLGPAAVQLIRSAGAAHRVLALLDCAAPTEVQTAEASEEHTGLAVSELSIGWPDGGIVAESIDLTIEPGSTLAIVGPSGIGKTTLLYTLAGLLPPKEGSALLDGRPVYGMSRDEVSQTLVLTAEDAHVFATSVLENIRVARADVSEEEATELLTEAGLGPWLAELPDGLDTLLGPNATTISGGERRRLLLARALASPAQYLLLDEPAEHLDAETADSLIRDLLAVGRRSGRRRTVILVTHRLSALSDADHVVVLNEGEIRAAGTHEELAAILPDYRWSLEQEEIR